MRIRRRLVRRLAALLALLSAAPAAARVIEFTSGDFVHTQSVSIPAAGWVAGPVPAVWNKPQNVARGIDPPTVWVRFRFDRAAVGPGPAALFSDRMRERYAVYLNGVDLYRSSGTATDTSYGWHRPLFLPLPEALLRPRGNELVYRVETVMARPLSVGTVRVGPDAPLRAAFRQRMVLSVDAPRTIAFVIAVLAIGAALFWVARPRERVFGWLALVGALWWFWDLQYFIYAVPIDDALFWRLIVDSLFLLVWATYGFALEFLAVRGRRRIVAWSFAVVLGMIAVRETLLALDLSDKPSFLLILPFSAATLYLLAQACRREPRVENFMMLAAVAATTGFGFHDLGHVSNAFRGATFQLQPYGGLLVFLAFGFALGRRVLVALATIEDVNLTLAARVRDATAELNRSEAERRRLEVTSAVDGERERMMREIHDGIGSSLITALAVATREHQSPNTIATLKRSIADLRIGVDSLEPLGGDVVMLLASLRHRMDRELGDAGLVFVWKAMSAPPLLWLDAVGALHILRILQEAIGNVLKHAEATQVEVDCAPAGHDGRDGVLVTITDNGRGFAPRAGHGRGLLNMAARAEALHANFKYGSAAGAGTKLSLWLPYARPDLS